MEKQIYHFFLNTVYSCMGNMMLTVVSFIVAGDLCHDTFLSCRSGQWCANMSSLFIVVLGELC